MELSPAGHSSSRLKCFETSPKNSFYSLYGLRQCGLKVALWKEEKIYIYFFQPKAPDGSILPMMYDVNHEEDKVSMIRKKKARNLRRLSILKQPISSTLNNHLMDYPTPSDISYWWGSGSLAGPCLVI
jgi:hypothetical protein